MPSGIRLVRGLDWKQAMDPRSSYIHLMLGVRPYSMMRVLSLCLRFIWRRAELRVSR